MNGFSDLTDALQLYQNQYSDVDKIWAYFSTATLALLGFSIGSDKASKSLTDSLIIVGAYLVFCVGNYGALMAAQGELVDIGQLATHIAEINEMPYAGPKPLPVAQLQWFYWAVVIVISLAVLAITHRRRKELSQPAEATRETSTATE